MFRRKWTVLRYAIPDGQERIYSAYCYSCKRMHTMLGRDWVLEQKGRKTRMRCARSLKKER